MTKNLITPVPTTVVTSQQTKMLMEFLREHGFEVGVMDATQITPDAPADARIVSVKCSGRDELAKLRKCMRHQRLADLPTTALLDDAKIATVSRDIYLVAFPMLGVLDPGAVE